MIRRYLPSMAVVLLLFASPALFGWWLVEDYALVDRYDHFTLALSSLVPLAFPLLATLLYGLYFSQELSAGAWLPLQLRRGRRGYLLRHLGRAAALGFVVGAVMIAIVGVLTLWATPKFGWVTYFPDPGARVPVERFTFAQLLPLGDAAFLSSYAAWVGVHAALYGMLGVLALVNVSNRLLALALPAVGQFLIDFLLAVLGLARWGMIAAVFPFNLRQIPLHVPLISTLAFLLIVAALAAWTLSARRSPAGYQ